MRRKHVNWVDRGQHWFDTAEYAGTDPPEGSTWPEPESICRACAKAKPPIRVLQGITHYQRLWLLMGCLHGAIVAAIDRRDRLCRRSRRLHRHATVGATGCAIDWPIIAPIVAPTVASCKQTSDRSRRRSLRLLHCVNILLDCYTFIRVRDFHDFIRVTQPACFPALFNQFVWTQRYAMDNADLFSTVHA